MNAQAAGPAPSSHPQHRRGRHGPEARAPCRSTCRTALAAASAISSFDAVPESARPTVVGRSIRSKTARSASRRAPASSAASALGSSTPEVTRVMSPGIPRASTGTTRCATPRDARAIRSPRAVGGSARAATTCYAAGSHRSSLRERSVADLAHLAVLEDAHVRDARLSREGRVAYEVVQRPVQRDEAARADEVEHLPLLPAVRVAAHVNRAIRTTTCAARPPGAGGRPSRASRRSRCRG